jgi:hypothetical protein
MMQPLHLVRTIELDPSLTAARMDFVNLSLTQAFYGFLAPAVAADHVRHAAEPSLSPQVLAEQLLVKR